MTGAEFIAYVKRTFIRTDKDTELYETTTDVIQYLLETHPFEDFKKVSYTTALSTAGDYSTTLPTDFDHLIGDVVLQYDSYSRPLIKLSKQDYDRLYPYPDDTDVSDGVPKHYCIYSGNIYVGPVPDRTDYAYQINYAYKQTAAIISGTTSVPFTANNRKMLKELVLGSIYGDLGNDEAANRHQTIGQALLDVLINKEEDNLNETTIVKFWDV